MEIFSKQFWRNILIQYGVPELMMIYRPHKKALLYKEIFDFYFETNLQATWKIQKFLKNKPVLCKLKNTFRVKIHL